MRNIAFLCVVILISLFGSGCELFDPLPPEGWIYVTISGKVYDVHNNPISGARILVSSGGQTVDVEAFSDSLGFFILNKVLIQKGVYFNIHPEKSGYSEYYNGTAPMYVYVDKANFTKDLWLLNLHEGAIISVSGRVTNTEGIPLAGIGVSLGFTSPLSVADDGSPCTSSLHQTDSNGFYTIQNVVVRPKTFFEVQYYSSEFPSDCSYGHFVYCDSSFIVDKVLVGYKTNIDISGVVLNSRNNPITEAEISIRGFNTSEFEYKILTDKEGHFSIQQLTVEKPSNLYITASKSGYESQTTKITIGSDLVVVIPSFKLTPTD